MVPTVPESTPSRMRSAGIGIAIGTGVFVLFIVAGFLIESWSLRDFLSNLTLETVPWLLLVGGLAIATFAVPIALYLHARILSPLILLGGIIAGWLVLGVVSGSIAAGAIFGLSLYAIGPSPFYIVLYLVLGGGEYYLRTRGQPSLR